MPWKFTFFQFSPPNMKILTSLELPTCFYLALSCLNYPPNSSVFCNAGKLTTMIFHILFS